MPWLVHLLTASSAVIAFFALRAAVDGDHGGALLWLALAAAIDAVDGALARAVSVKTRTPHFDGTLLDNIVDYLTFVFVPAWIVYDAGLLPAGWADAVVAAVLLASAYQFSHAQAKTADHFFTGFPSYWNVVAVYLVALDASPAVNAAVLLALAALVFVPIRYVYPSRTPTLRWLTVSLGLAWAVAVLAIIWQLPDAPRRLVWVSLVYPAYYVGLSLVLHGRRATGARVPP